MNEQPHEFGYVYTCYDPMIRDEILEFCDKRFGKGNYFFDCDPGGAKNLVFARDTHDIDFVLYKMQLAAKVHPYTVVLLINHSVCGAYSDAGMVFTVPDLETAYHKIQLESAVTFLKDKLAHGISIEHHYFLKKEQKFAW